jgi:hypothetical protein
MEFYSDAQQLRHSTSPESRVRSSRLTGCSQLRIDSSVSVAYCERSLRALYALVNSNRSTPFAVSSALKRNPETFVLSRIE